MKPLGIALKISLKLNIRLMLIAEIKLNYMSMIYLMEHLKLEVMIGVLKPFQILLRLFSFISIVAEG